MKKVFLLFLVLCVFMTACASNKEIPESDVVNENPAAEENPVEEGKSGLAFDSTEYDSLDEMNAAAGTNIKAPGAGEADEIFSVISKNIAQYTFKIGNEEWCVRASKDVDNDISGLYYDNMKFEKDTNYTFYNDEAYLLRFFNEDVQYAVTLNTAGKDIAMSYFDDMSSKIKTGITGVKSGYETDLKEDGNDVIYTTTMYNDDGTTTIMQIVYTFDNDKMVSIINNNIFETEESAEEYYKMLLESGFSEDDIKLEGKIISSDSSGNLDFYSSYTKDEFFKMMQSSMSQ